jgi:hypothetical protein
MLINTTFQAAGLDAVAAVTVGVVRRAQVLGRPFTRSHRGVQRSDGLSSEPSGFLPIRKLLLTHLFSSMLIHCSLHWAGL